MQGEQSNNIIPINTRTFSEIYKSLLKKEAINLRIKICSALMVTEQTVRNWGDGKTIPVNMPTRKAVREIVDRSLGIRTSVATLFPES